MIIDGQMPGLPYRGYSMPQVRMFARKALRQKKMEEVGLAAAHRVGIATLFDKKATKVFAELTKKATEE